MGNFSPEQLQEMRKRFESMSEEERAEAMKRFGGNRGGGGDGPRSGGDRGGRGGGSRGPRGGSDGGGGTP